ncbi:MAG: pentapeptide repeat-containing protein [Nostochopsis sp.]
MFDQYCYFTDVILSEADLSGVVLNEADLSAEVIPPKCL